MARPAGTSRSGASVSPGGCPCPDPAPAARTAPRAARSPGSRSPCVRCSMPAHGAATSAAGRRSPSSSPGSGRTTAAPPCAPGAPADPAAPPAAHTPRSAPRTPRPQVHRVVPHQRPICVPRVGAEEGHQGPPGTYESGRRVTDCSSFSAAVITATPRSPAAAPRVAARPIARGSSALLSTSPPVLLYADDHRSPPFVVPNSLSGGDPVRSPQGGGSRVAFHAWRRQRTRGVRR